MKYRGKNIAQLVQKRLHCYTIFPRLSTSVVEGNIYANDEDSSARQVTNVHFSQPEGRGEAEFKQCSFEKVIPGMYVVIIIHHLICNSSDASLR